MIETATANENDQERGVRQALEARLMDGERLAAFTTGKVFSVTGAAYYIGLTCDRLVFLPLKHGAPAKHAYGIWRDRVISLKVKGAGLFASRLELRLANDRLDFVTQGGSWRQRAKAFAQWDRLPASAPANDPAIQGQQHLRQAHDFQGLGLIGLAHDELNAAERANPMLGSQPGLLQPLKAQVAETRLAWRVAAGFLFGHVGVIAGLTGLLALFGGAPAVSEFWSLDLLISLGVALWLGVHLWRGQRQARLTTVYATFVGFLLFALVPLMFGGSVITLISQAAFNGAIWLALAGDGKRVRTWSAIGVYVIGYLGVLAMLVLIDILAAVLASL